MKLRNEKNRTLHSSLGELQGTSIAVEPLVTLSCCSVKFLLLQVQRSRLWMARVTFSVLTFSCPFKSKSLNFPSRCQTKLSVIFAPDSRFLGPFLAPGPHPHPCFQAKCSACRWTKNIFVNVYVYVYVYEMEIVIHFAFLLLLQFGKLDLFWRQCPTGVLE